MKCCLFRSKWRWYHVPTVCFWKDVISYGAYSISSASVRLAMKYSCHLLRFSHQWIKRLVSFIIKGYWYFISAVSFLSTPNLLTYGGRSESALTREILVLTLYINRRKILKSYVLPIEHICAFRTALRTNVIISVHSIYVFVFITRDGMFTVP